MEYFAHQGIDHGSPFESVLHFITSPPLLLFSAVIVAVVAVVVIRRQTEMKASKVLVKEKDK